MWPLCLLCCALPTAITETCLCAVLTVRQTKEVEEPAIQTDASAEAVIGEAKADSAAATTEDKADTVGETSTTEATTKTKSE